jgi:hypothetical protein
MKRTILQAAVLSAFGAALMCGQTTGTTGTAPTPPTPAQIAANIVARLTTLLDLTSSQQTSATAIFTADATTDQSLQTQMQTAQTALQTAVTSIHERNRGRGGHHRRLTTQQVTADATADADFYAILTATQQTKYATLKPGLGGADRWGPGPGGPPPGPAGRAVRALNQDAGPARS